MKKERYTLNLAQKTLSSSISLCCCSSSGSFFPPFCTDNLHISNEYNNNFGNGDVVLKRIVSKTRGGRWANILSTTKLTMKNKSRKGKCDAPTAASLLYQIIVLVNVFGFNFSYFIKHLSKEKYTLRIMSKVIF